MTRLIEFVVRVVKTIRTAVSGQSVNPDGTPRYFVDGKELSPVRIKTRRQR